MTSSTAKPRARRVLLLGAAILGCNAVGVLGALFTSTDTAWYRELVKPAFQPPGWLFGPVWTLLYTLMGIAVFRVYERPSQTGRRGAFFFFGGQLFLNAIWSPIFFGAHALRAALFVIVCLTVVLAVTLKRFAAIDRTAGALLVPYLAWVSFATVLNAAIVVLN